MKKKHHSEATLWRWFSIYIRLRDSDENGFCKCFTCGRVIHWRVMDCGHGVPRQHKATKYNEQNNHAQCKRCNGFEEGRKDIYSRRVDELYGSGTWDKLLLASRQPCRRSNYEISLMTETYKAMVFNLANIKQIKL